MISISCLLASHSSHLLIGSHEAFAFLHGAFANLPQVLLFLLGRK